MEATNKSSLVETFGLLREISQVGVGKSVQNELGKYLKRSQISIGPRASSPLSLKVAQAPGASRGLCKNTIRPQDRELP